MDPPDSMSSNTSIIGYRSGISGSGLYYTDIRSIRVNPNFIFSNEIIQDDVSNVDPMKTNRLKSKEKVSSNRSSDSLVVMPRKRNESESDVSEEVGPSKRARLSPTLSEEHKRHTRQNHSEIEKRRRDKMNTYINELATMVPTCMNMSRKMDKLTVLRLAVQHIRSLRGCASSPYSISKPSVLNDQEMKRLVLGSVADDGFVFVVDSSRGKMIYVSDNVRKIIGYSQNDLFGQSLFDIVHPKDVSKVKEQISASDLTPRDRLIDPKTMLPVNAADLSFQNTSFFKSSPGARRSFFCRMKIKTIKDDVRSDEDQQQQHRGGKRRNGSQTNDKKYAVIQCTGFLKSWPVAKMELSTIDVKLEESFGSSSDGCMSCLVAVGRLQPSLKLAIDDATCRGRETVEGVEFVARHTTDGKFCFADQRITPMLGYLPQEILGTSVYEHIQFNDIPEVSEAHRRTLRLGDEVSLGPFRFRGKDGNFLKLKATWKRFRNPWTKEIDYIVSRYFICVAQPNNDVSKTEKEPLCSMSEQELNFFEPRSEPSTSTSCIGDIQRMITGHAEASKIGQQIADEEIRLVNCSSNHGSTNTSPLSALLQSANGNNSPLASLNTPGQSPIEASDLISDYVVSADQSPMMSDTSNIVNYSTPSPTLSSSLLQSPLERPTNCNTQLENHSTMQTNHFTNEGSDDAAMAVIMSLLEADAGLGGPVDFSWSLN